MRNNMKSLIILVSATLLYSCVPQQMETPALAQQPEPEIAKAPAATVTQVKTPTQKIVATPELTTYNGNYAHWINPNGKKPRSRIDRAFQYGVISILAVDQETNSVSFTTMFSGNRNEHSAAFELSAAPENAVAGSPEVLTVSTKEFNFHTDGKHLWIDLYDGNPQKNAAKMVRLAPQKYDASTRGDLHRPVGTNFRKMEVLTGKFENASMTLLKSKDVENLRAVDLEIMKESIYARHGAAFEDSRLTNYFFDTDWYVPIFTKYEVSEKLTPIELKNINLIGRFEKHAKRYYESFGR